MVLLESHQELSDGSIRKRDIPLSEKLKSGEGIEAAVKRAIREELGSVLSRGKDDKDVKFDEIVRIFPDSYDKKVKERISVSYPGLPACYVVHTMDAIVEGLPDGDFVTEEESMGRVRQKLNVRRFRLRSTFGDGFERIRLSNLIW